MWRFSSRGNDETEGFSHGSLAEFRGNPLQALAREVCQNSLDAADGSGKPVIVEFESYYISMDSFPGMKSMREVIKACQSFWKGRGDVNTETFLNKASESFAVSSGKFRVLRISDYNTKGLSGAFSKEDITPWGSLVKGNSFCVKSEDAAGSYGIGKAAPFVSSCYQTVFYRTLAEDGVPAALGVARLMAHKSITPVRDAEDPVRRSVGYFGADKDGMPAKSFPELDQLHKRTSVGTDLFIPGFTGVSSGEEWIKEMLKEIVDNFLYSIYSGKLEIKIEHRVLNRKNLRDMLDYIGSKDAKIFYEVIYNNENVHEFQMPFHNLGTVHLRLLYGDKLNKKVLVVRNSGMKIARIKSLPRMVSYTGFLELQGYDLNKYFRGMENPSHNAWEPKRHPNPIQAKQYKEEIEEWVIETITQKLIEISGEESVIDIGDCFNFVASDEVVMNGHREERITDRTESVQTEVYQPKLPTGGKFSVRDEGMNGNNRRSKGRENPNGTAIGHRHRTGETGGGKPTGRRVSPDPSGLDSVYCGDGGGEKPKEVLVTARIIRRTDGTNRLIYTAEENIQFGQMEIVAKGENGKSLQLQVCEVRGDSATCENGRIVIRNIPAHSKQTVDFVLTEKQCYAMGVRAYGN